MKEIDFKKKDGIRFTNGSDIEVSYVGEIKARLCVYRFVLLANDDLFRVNIYGKSRDSRDIENVPDTVKVHIVTWLQGSIPMSQTFCDYDLAIELYSKLPGPRSSRDINSIALVRA